MTRVEPFYDEATNTLTYLVQDPASRDAVVIDPVLDYDSAASRISRTSLQKIAGAVKAQQLNLRMLLETHAHADHLSSAAELKALFPAATLAIGERIRDVQATFKKIFSLGGEFKTDGSQFDLLLKEGETVRVGTLSFKVYFTPGHTAACCSYLFGDALFTGDALFMPDSGTGRCDFPGGDARLLYRSISKVIYGLPDSTRIFPAHDYQPGGRPLRYESTVGEEKAKNIQLCAETSEDTFVQFRTDRDKTLTTPKLLYPSVQINIDGGRLPRPDANGQRFLKIPLS